MKFEKAFNWMRKSEKNHAMFYALRYRVSGDALQFYSEYKKEWADSQLTPVKCLGKWEKVKPKLKPVSFVVAMRYLERSAQGTTIVRRPQETLYRLSCGRGMALECNLKVGGNYKGWKSSRSSLDNMLNSQFYIPADFDDQSDENV